MTDVTNVPKRDIATGFRDVDRTGDPGYYMRFLEGVSGVEWIRRVKRRMTRPGGHVVAAQPDLETMVIYPGDKATTRHITQTYVDGFPTAGSDARSSPSSWTPAWPRSSRCPRCC